jgi:hypothetical protein
MTKFLSFINNKTLFQRVSKRRCKFKGHLYAIKFICPVLLQLDPQCYTLKQQLKYVIDGSENEKKKIEREIFFSSSDRSPVRFCCSTKISLLHLKIAGEGEGKRERKRVRVKYDFLDKE